MINQDKIGAIQIEFGGCNIDLRTFFGDFWFQLHEKNYVYRIARKGLFPISNYEERLEIFSCVNYLFVHKKYKKI